jgi:transposase
LTHTAIAVTSTSGELVDELSAAARASGYAQLLQWAQAIDDERVGALEDVRGVSRGLEGFLLERGERVVRIPPKLMAGPARARGRDFLLDAAVVVLMPVRTQPEGLRHSAG